MQEKITIINVKRSTPDKTFKQTIYLSAWQNAEAKLRGQGWLPSNDIEKVEYEEVNDGLGMEEVEIIESTEEKDGDLNDLDSLSLEELKAECDKRGIKYHHASKANKLIALLSE